VKVRKADQTQPRKVGVVGASVGPHP